MAKLRLLVIEDDADQRDLIRQTLENHFGNGTVTAVATMAEALQQDLWSFDLILSDYNLPDANGLELLGAIRDRCTTPIILVTGENVGTIAVEAIRKGATDYVVKFGDYLFTIPLIVEKNLTVAKLTRENDCLRRELEQALADLRDKNAQLEESLKREQEMAATDPLTGLYNRRHFGRVLEQLFAEAQRYNQELSAVMIDMDGFKRLNDTRGHQIGDQLLMLAGKVISANMRRMDVAARYGGDEFVLLLPHAGAQDAAAVAQRICEEFKSASASILNRGPGQGVTMSVGICSLNQHRPAGADQLIAMADAALYKAKELGRDRIALAPVGESESAALRGGAAWSAPMAAALHRQL
ncbi:diguanylate cyclase [Fontivita pretiosa]|uniref:diguanylate cyclase n=1 Tax=Fontivita pretiosa TaxID=2989684 RepID=UPI003D16627B